MFGIVPYDFLTRRQTVIEMSYTSGNMYECYYEVLHTRRFWHQSITSDPLNFNLLTEMTDCSLILLIITKLSNVNLFSSL